MREAVSMIRNAPVGRRRILAVGLSGCLSLCPDTEPRSSTVSAQAPASSRRCAHAAATAWGCRRSPFPAPWGAPDVTVRRPAAISPRRAGVAGSLFPGGLQTLDQGGRARLHNRANSGGSGSCAST